MAHDSSSYNYLLVCCVNTTLPRILLLLIKPAIIKIRAVIAEPIVVRILDVSARLPSLINRPTITSTPKFTTTPNKNTVTAAAYSLFDLNAVNAASEIPNAARDNITMGRANGNNQPFWPARFCINRRYRITLKVNPANNPRNLYLLNNNNGETVDHTTINAPIGYKDQLMVRSTEKFVIRQTKEANKTKEVIIKNNLRL